MSWLLDWAKPASLYFEGGGGVFCWVLLLWLCFYFSNFPLRSHTFGEACLSLPFLWPDALEHLTWALLCPLLCAFLQERKITPRCNVRGIACDVVRCFFPSNSTVFRPFSVCLGLRDAWQMGEGAALRTCQTESTRWAEHAFLPNKSVILIHMPLTATETLWLVNSWPSSPRWCLLWILVPKSLIFVCLFSSLNRFKPCKSVPVTPEWILPSPETMLCSAN